MANYVTFDQANWLKEKGFDEICVSCYHSFLKIGEDGEIKLPLVRESTQRKFQNSTINKHHISRPEQYQVIEWLIIHHSIWVLIDIVDINDACNYVIKWRNNLCLNENRGSGYKTQKEAYSAAFDYIKNNNLIIV